MTIRTVPATRSLTWLGQAVALVFTHPVFLLMGLFIGVIGSLPILGPLVLLVINPALYGGICHAARECLNDRPLHFTHLFEAINQPGKIASMLALSLPGLLTLSTLIVGMILIVALAGPAYDPGRPAMEASEFLGVLMPWFGALGALMFVLGILIFVLTFLAIPCVMFTTTPALQAMRKSLVACSRNALAIVLYLLMMFMILVPLLLLTSPFPILMNLLVAVVITPVIAVSSCLAWIDICQPDDSSNPAPPSPPDGGGLVA